MCGSARSLLLMTCLILPPAAPVENSSQHHATQTKVPILAVLQIRIWSDPELLLRSRSIIISFGSGKHRIFVNFVIFNVSRFVFWTNFHIFKFSILKNSSFPYFGKVGGGSGSGSWTKSFRIPKKKFEKRINRYFNQRCRSGSSFKKSSWIVDPDLHNYRCGSATLLLII